MDAYLRGLEHDSLETLCRDLAQVVKTGSSELQLGRAVCKLFKRFNLGGEKLPPGPCWLLRIDAENRKPLA